VSTVLPEPEDYGYLSNDFLLKHALFHIPHINLYRGTVALVKYLVESDVVDPLEALDLLTQTALTGQYIPLPGIVGDRGPEVTIVGYVPAEGEVSDISEEEIAKFVEDMSALGPDAEDPFDGVTL